MPNKKTCMLLINNIDSSDLCFFEINGDYSHLHHIISCEKAHKNGNEDPKELFELIYGKDGLGVYNYEPLPEPIKNWDHFIVCWKGLCLTCHEDFFGNPFGKVND